MVSVGLLWPRMRCDKLGVMEEKAVSWILWRKYNLSAQHYGAKNHAAYISGRSNCPKRFNQKAAEKILKIFGKGKGATAGRKLLKGEAEYLEHKGYPCDLPTL